MTPDERRQAHDNRVARLEHEIASLPAYAREFVNAYRRPVELCGRAGPGGNALPLLECLVRDVRALLQAQWDAVLRNTGPGVDLRAKGSGV